MSMSAIILGFVFALNWLIWKIYTLRLLNQFFAMSIWTAIVMWYSIPGCVAALYQEETPFTPFYLLKPNASKSSWFVDFTFSYACEAAAVCIVLLIVLFTCKSNRKKFRQSGIVMGVERVSPNYKWLILVGFACALIYKILNFRGDYLSGNSAELYGSGDGISQVIGTLIHPLTYGMTFLIVVFEKKSRPILITSFVLILFESLFNTIFNAARIHIIALVFVYIFRTILLGSQTNHISPVVFLDQYPQPRQRVKTKRNSSNNAKKILITFGLSGLFLTQIFLPIASAISQVRASDKINAYEVLNKAFFTPKDSHQSENGGLANSIASEVFIKLDTFTAGSLLTSESGYGTAGVTPYIGSALLILPRPFFPDKPAAGTSDGTILTHPSRLVARSVGVYSDSLNMGVAQLNITLWHFGVLGFPVFVGALFLYFRLLNWMFDSRSFIYNSLGLFLMNVPNFATVIVSPDVILKDFVLVACFVVFLKLLSWLNPGSKLKQHRI
jgi:hypothetical protein